MYPNVCICAAKSEVDLKGIGIHNWTTMCDCDIQPVVCLIRNKHVAEMVKSKPNFDIDLIKVKAVKWVSPKQNKDYKRE